MRISDERFATAMVGATPVVTLGFLRHAGLMVMLVERDGSVSYACDAVLRHLGAPDDRDAVGRAWWTFWPKEQHPTLRIAVTRAGLGDVVTLDFGGLSATLTPVRGSAGGVLRILVTLRESRGP